MLCTHGLTFCKNVSFLALALSLAFRSCLKSNSTDILVFFRLFVIKKNVCPIFTYLGLQWSVFGRNKTQIDDNFILETLERAKSAKNKHSPRVRARLLMHICKNLILEKLDIFLTYTWVLLVHFWQASLRQHFFFLSN